MPRRYVRINNDMDAPLPPPPQPEINSAAFQATVSAAVTALLAHIHDGNNGVEMAREQEAPPME